MAEIITKEILRKNHIGGIWQTRNDNKFQAQNPFDGEKGAVFTEADSKQVDIAVTGAVSAFEIGRKKDMKSRTGLLDSIAEELEALGSQPIEVWNAETGLGETRLKGERARTCGQLRTFAKLIPQGDWQQAGIATAIPVREPLPRLEIRRILRPLGTVAIFLASNFPLAFFNLGGDIASAITTCRITQQKS